jgi:hypothetical protein
MKKLIYKIGTQEFNHNADDPKFAFELLKNTDDDDKDTIERYKFIIINSKDPNLAYRLLLHKQEVQELNKKISGQIPLKTPYLTVDEQATLKNLIIESQDPLLAY